MDLQEQQLLRTIVREEMKSALKEIGLHDDDAGDDVRDLRSLITDWRKVTWQERPTILPRSVWEKYADKEFWRVPAVPEPDFVVDTGYEMGREQG